MRKVIKLGFYKKNFFVYQGNILDLSKLREIGTIRDYLLEIINLI